MTWVLLIYTVPAQPPGKRAAIWRDVKRSGAIYLRDGVCALPDEPERVTTFEDIARKVDEMGGQATVAKSAEIKAEKSRFIFQEARSARSHEYDDLRREVEVFSLHVKQEGQRREFGFSELEQMEADLAKLRRWSLQIAGRDFETSPVQQEVAGLLDNCEAELASYLNAAYQREEAGR